MKFKGIISLIILLFISFTGNTQNVISGRIIDLDSLPIPYAKIVLLEIENENFIEGATTDLNGEFKINFSNKINGVLKISYIGYQDTLISIKKADITSLGDITLLKSSNLLEGVTITAEEVFLTKREDKLIISVQNSPLKSGYNAIEVLERSPYVWIDSRGNIVMRNETATVLINGQRLNLTGADLTNYLTTIDSDNIERIEIQTNNGANTDAESSGGTINFILKKKPLGLNSRLKNYYTVEGDKYYTLFSGINFNYGAEKFNTYGNYEYVKRKSSSNTFSDINYIETGNYLATNRISEFEFDRHKYQLGFVAQPIKKHEFGLELYGANSNKLSDNEGKLDLSNNFISLDSGVINNSTMMDNYTINGLANYSWSIDTNNSKLHVFLDYSQQQVSNQNSNQSIYNLGFLNNNQELNYNSAKTSIYVIQSDYNVQFKSKIKLELGAKYSATNRLNTLTSTGLVNNYFVIDSSRTTSYEYDENITAGYFTLSKTHKIKNYYKIGLRIENTFLNRNDLITKSKIAQNYTGLFPSFYYSRDMKKKRTVSASFSRSLSRPSFTLLNNNITKINDFKYELGNPDLEPQYVSKFELSYLFKKQTVSVYYKKVNNAINGVYFLDGDIAYYKKFNSGSQLQAGGEYNVSKKIKKWWYLKFSGNLFYREFVNEQGLSTFGKITTYFNIYNNFKLNQTTSIDLSGYYLSPKSDAYYIASERYKIDVVLKKSFLDKKLNIRIYINDVFNTLIYANEREFNGYTTTSNQKTRTRSITFWLTYNIVNGNKTQNSKNQSKNDTRYRL